MSQINPSNWQVILTKISELNDILDKMYWIDIHVIQTADHGPISEVDHVLGHKPSLNKYREMEIIGCILSDLACKTINQQ